MEVGESEVQDHPQLHSKYRASLSCVRPYLKNTESNKQNRDTQNPGHREGLVFISEILRSSSPSGLGAYSIDISVKT